MEAGDEDDDEAPAEPPRKRQRRVHGPYLKTLEGAAKAREITLRRVMVHIHGRRGYAGSAWGPVDEALMCREILRVLDTGCTLCGQPCAYGAPGMPTLPSIDRVNPLLPYATATLQNWRIECVSCNRRKSNATVAERAVLIAGLDKMALRHASIVRSSGALVARPPSKRVHLRTTCEQCSTGAVRFCQDCNAHVLLAEFGNGYCKRHVSERTTAAHAAAKAGLQTPHQPPHVCSDTCGKLRNAAFCRSPHHMAHLPRPDMMHTHRQCIYCVRIDALISNARKRARKYTKPFDESAEFRARIYAVALRQRACSYCEVLFDQSPAPRATHLSASISLDCFIPADGYTFSNTVLCCYACNSYKSDSSLTELKAIQACHIWALANPVGAETSPCPPWPQPPAATTTTTTTAAVATTTTTTTTTS